MPRVTGVFKNDKDTFTADRHSVKFRVSPGKRLREAQLSVKVEKVAAVKPAPLPLQYFDQFSETGSNVITPKGSAYIKGRRLKINEADSSQGIYFINTKTGAEAKAAGKLLKNMPAELIFANPFLPPGKYTIEVRNTQNKSAVLRKATLPKALTVK